MKKVPVHIRYEIDNTYDIVFKKGILESIDNFIIQLPDAHRYVIITDTKVEELYGRKLFEQLKVKGLQIDLLSFPNGEDNKNQKNKAVLDQKLLDLQCGRDTLIIALGGGVVGDLAGYVAATFMRGIPYIQVPTTLLAMVDSSVGGKTAIDTMHGKNLIGAFWQPQKVIVDIDCIQTLPHEHVVNGLIEAIKMFCTHDKEMFEYVSKNIDAILGKKSEVLEKVIARAVEIKSSVVERDEREFNERMVLNFGHTIGHAIEKLSNYKLIHGVAVGLGMIVECKIAEQVSGFTVDQTEQVVGILEKMDVRREELNKYSVVEIVKSTILDKKSRKGAARYVILSSIGEVKQDGDTYVYEVSNDIVEQAIKEVLK